MTVKPMDSAREALNVIPPDCDRKAWVRIGMAAKAAGLTYDDFDDWSANAANYGGRRDTAAVWRSIDPEGGISQRTLYEVAKRHGYRHPHGRPVAHPRRSEPVSQRLKSRRLQAVDVWNQCEPATFAHPYIQAKAGNPEGLRVVPDGSALAIAGERMAGWLAVPVRTHVGELVSIQFIAPPDVAANLKAKGKHGKLNLPGGAMSGMFLVGTVKPDAPLHFVEGIGAAWAIQKANGGASVVCFGWNNIEKRAAEIRERDAAAQLVIVPDVGKEADAERIARDVRGTVVALPTGWPQNADVNDYAMREGFPALEALLERARGPQEAPMRYRLIDASELRLLPPMAWRIRHILPMSGLAAIFGPSTAGKSFLALDMASAIAMDRPWFGHKVRQAPVVYCALEGEGGLRLRIQAWEAATEQASPLKVMMQPFKLTEPEDVRDLADAILGLGGGAVTVIDTLNRAAPTADENSSRDMGEILEACKSLQRMTSGLVVLVHHTGKDATKGLRGHSSLFAALDAAIEVTRNGERREWTVGKVKDGEDGKAHAFRLRVVDLGTDEEGEPVTSCVIDPDTSEAQIKRTPVPQGGNQKLAWEAIQPMFKDGRYNRPGVPANRPAVALEDAVRVAASRLAVPSERRSARAREAITGLASRGLLGCHDGWLWLA